MIEIQSKKEGEGRNTRTKLLWDYKGKKVVLSFQSIARHIIVEDNNSLFVSLYSEDKICQYAMNGNLLTTFKIPEKEGYKYRGINRSLEAKHGISLLYVPTEEGYGNEWKDIEQYELESETNPLGSYLNIYR